MKQQLTLFLIVAFIGVTLWMTLRRSPQKQILTARSLATEMMARDLAKRYPGAHALVFSNPYAQTTGRRHAIQDVEQAGIDGLKAGFGTTISIKEVVFPEIHPEAEADPRAFIRTLPTTDTPLSYLIAEDAFDKLSAAHPECSIMVSLIGFPARLDKVNIWTRSGPPHFAMLLPDLRMLGSQEALRAAMKSGKLAAVITEKPGAPPSQEPLKDSPEEEFNRRFLLVTPENVDQLIEQYSEHFTIYPIR